MLAGAGGWHGTPHEGQRANEVVVDILTIIVFIMIIIVI